MKAFMFPGQGAQRIGMGEGLFEAFPDLTARADDILGYPVRDLCLEGPLERLTHTRFTQPALYVVCALQYLKTVEETGKPEYVLGHSVGEYAALFAAGVLDFETGLRLVQKRGELMGQAIGGGMAAVLGLDEAAVAEVIRKNGLETVFPANFNTPKQIVISGKREDVVQAESIFLDAGASHFKVLRVSGAFHTPFMAPARDEYREFIDGMTFAAPTMNVMSNVTARPHVAESIRERMVEQITSPVRWCDGIRYLLAKGLAFKDFEEIGPQGMPNVKPMVKRIEMEAGPLDAAELETEEREAEASSRPQQSEAVSGRPASKGLAAETLGSLAFRDAFNVKYAYVAGGMYQGISSADLVIRLAKAGMLGFFGAGGLDLPTVEAAIARIQAEIPPGAPYGVNFVAHTNFLEMEDRLADVLLKHRVNLIEASAFIQVTPALVRYRAKGLEKTGGRVRARNRIIAKVSRPEVVEEFLSPAPDRIVSKLRDEGRITPEEAEWLREVPMADALCAESDSGGHTDQGVPFTLIPAILRVRDRAADRFPAFGPIPVGAGGGIGTPESAAAAFVLGADFVLTGSINQCTVEARTSDLAKDLLVGMGAQDTDYAPSPDLFEYGSKVQVLKKGLFYPARANKLAGLYRQHDSLDEIVGDARRQIEERYFRRSLDQVFADVCAAYPAEEIERAKRLPKHRMALVFKRYFKDTTRWALEGNADHKVDFQIHCGPAMGAFNQWVGDGEAADWRQRHVDAIAVRLMDETASLLNRRFVQMQGTGWIDGSAAAE